MQQRVGDITIESIASESAKFAAPLVLVHGLWCSAAVWRKFMGYLAHRGWTCHAVNLRGHGDAGGRERISGVRIADYLSDLQRVIELCDAAPVVMGHDLGGLLALACPPGATRAVVALAPLVPRAISGGLRPAVLPTWRSRLAMWRARPLAPPRGKVGAEYFAAAPPGGATVDSVRAASELDDRVFRLRIGSECPALLVAGECDRISPPGAVERLAQHAGAQFRIAERSGHAMPWASGWEQHVVATHRWIIQTLGEPLLLLRDDE
jgi:pimeloyl-ACP methyl ester carboxylesterase